MKALLLWMLLTAAAVGAAPADGPARFFPIMPWDGLHGWTEVEGFSHPLESVKECNFTVAGFVDPADLPICERLGLKAIVLTQAQRDEWRKRATTLSAEQAEARARRWIAEAGDSTAVIGYYITDEPGTKEFAALGAQVAALRKLAPGKLGYINLYPGYATIGNPDRSQLGANSYAEYLERYIQEVKPDFLSYDDYKIMVSDNMQSASDAAVYFRDLLEVRRVGLKTGLPFWNTISSNRIRPWTVAPTPSNLMLQAYTSLAAGYSGIAWFTYNQRRYDYAPIDASGRRTQTWYWLRDVNRQIATLGPIVAGMKSTGVFFTRPPEKGMPLMPGKLIKSVRARTSIKGFSQDEPSIMVGEFAGDEGAHAMVVNLSLEKSANLRMETVEAGRKLEWISAEDGRPRSVDLENGLWLAPGQGALIRVR